MSQRRSSGVIELSIEPNGVRAELLEWLHHRGVHDFVEASCDFLDTVAEEAASHLAAYEQGALELPLLIYSYHAPWIEALTTALHQHFQDQLRIRVREIRDELWQEAWQQEFDQLETNRFIIVGEDAEAPASAKQVIRLRSGTVFGSGQHATTQALLRLFEIAPGQGRLLDVGTGTGVLALAGSFLGFSEIWATDIELEAITVAQYNQHLNGIPLRLLHQSLPEAGELFGTIVCNILPPTLTHLLPELVDRLETEGQLLLAGFHGAHEEQIVRLLTELGMCEGDRIEQRGWLAARFIKRA
jgi:ribosomal protein L11 methyltransferase